VKLTRHHLLALTAIFVLVLVAGCSDRDPASLPVSRGNTEPLVFDDAYDPDVYFQAFFATHVAAVSVDSVYAHDGLAVDGARSLKINVPPVGSALGGYSGGVLTSGGARNLSDYNALTFYARADAPIALDVAGLGNDNTGTSLYETGRTGVALTTDWTFVVVPIPDSRKLLSERGLFTFAESPEPAHPDGYNFWVDEIRYAKLSNIVVSRPSLTPATKSYFVGSRVAIDGTRTVYQIDGAYVPVDHSANYFDYTSSDPSVAVVERGVVKVVGVGPALITAKLDTFAVKGTLGVTGYLPPTSAAPVPTLPASSVISMFSGAYSNVPVDTWRTNWGGVTTQLEEFTIAGDVTKMYSSLNFVGIEFVTRTINASQMTHLHLDVYAPAGTDFKVKLVSFPDGPPPVAGAQTLDLVLNAASNPAFASGAWSSLDIPLESFQFPVTGPAWDWSRIGQLVLSSGDARLVLVDNVYFHR
jgi:hypothetical protein